MKMTVRGLLTAAALASITGAGCFRPPTVTLVDRKTALEMQAAGEYRGLSADLVQAGLSPRATPMTRAQVEAAGADTSRAGFDSVVQAYTSIRSDADVLDDLLVRRCIGEGTDGLLVETAPTCAGTYDPSTVSAAMQRTNRDRRQLWTWMASQRPGLTEEDVRKGWRKQHIDGVVCGANVQTDSGEWEARKCD